MIKRVLMLLGCLALLATLSGCHYFLHPWDVSYSYSTRAPRYHGGHGHGHGHRHYRYRGGGHHGGGHHGGGHRHRY